MAFTPAELASIANSALDWYISDSKSPFYQTIQDRPFLAAVERKAKSFPGGKGDISVAVKGNFGFPHDTANAPVTVPAGGSDKLKGYTHDDTVGFYTPANVLRANFPWREHHLGLTLTHTQLKLDGISVTDTDGKGTSNHSQREMTALINMLDDALFDFGEQYARGMNGLIWGDGTADPKALMGIRAFIVDNPAAGSVGGLSRATYSWWRNLALTDANGGKAVVADLSDGGSLSKALQSLFLQLRRYGGKPSAIFCGSDFLHQLESEFRANGNYSMTGFTGGKDMAVGDMSFNGLALNYDPSLDDLGRSKFGYIIDMDAIKLHKMDGEWRHQHSPSRPPEKYVLYRSITSTGQMVATRLNSSAVVEIK